MSYIILSNHKSSCDLLQQLEGNAGCTGSTHKPIRGWQKLIETPLICSSLRLFSIRWHGILEDQHTSSDDVA